jgi:Uma2 family endonuclease
MATAVPHVTTAEQLLEATGLGRCELVRGELIMMTPVSGEHARIVLKLGARLLAFVEEKRLGTVYAGDPGFHIGRDPDTVRAPDVAFVRAERLPKGPVRGFFQTPPDLAVEVLSPGDRAGEVLDKVHQWLEAGCRVVWVVDPEHQTVTVYEGPDRIATRTADDELTCDELLPGFGLAVKEIFAS